MFTGAGGGGEEEEEEEEKGFGTDAADEAEESENGSSARPEGLLRVLKLVVRRFRISNTFHTAWSN